MSSRIRKAVKPLTQAIRRAVGMEKQQVFVVSFPESGGTWLQVMLGEYITRFYGLDVKNVLALKDYTKHLKDIPRIRFTHADRPHETAPDNVETNTAGYKHHRVILLARDPQDIIWAKSRHISNHVKYVNYENLNSDPRGTLIDILCFIGMPELNEQILDKAVELGILNRARKVETDTVRGSTASVRIDPQVDNTFPSRAVQPADPAEPEVVKVPTGEVRSYNEVKPSISANWRIISFGSSEPALYSQAARRLQGQCESLGVDCDIPIISFDIVERNHICLYKPSFILEQLKQAPMPTLWLDCDAALVGAPSLPWNDDWDLGFVPNTQGSNAGGFLTKAGFIKKQRLSHWVNTVSGFAVAFRPTADTFHFLEIWKYLCEWPDLAPGGDHARMCWARKMIKLREINVARYLQGCVVRDVGQDKEHDLRGMHKLKLD